MQKLVKYKKHHNAGVVTSIRIDPELYLWAKHQQLNLSDVLDDAIRELRKNNANEPPKTTGNAGMEVAE